jgi:hypothetical protein
MEGSIYANHRAKQWEAPPGHLLARGTTYRELGADYYDRRHAERVTRRAIQALERQGYRVILEQAA